MENKWRYYGLIQELRLLSICEDKKVSCIITNEFDSILSIGINTTKHKECTLSTGECTCEAVHAEVNALRKLASWSIPYACYISLGPCEECQRALYLAGIKEVYVYNKQHKPTINHLELCTEFLGIAEGLIGNNGREKQLAVIQGELAELITAISDTFYRGDKAEYSKALDNLLDEIVDVKLQLSILSSILGHSVNLSKVQENKLNKVWGKLKNKGY
jgi:deoxycytidylate deaminase